MFGPPTFGGDLVFTLGTLGAAWATLRMGKVASLGQNSAGTRALILAGAVLAAFLLHLAVYVLSWSFTGAAMFQVSPASSTPSGLETFFGLHWAADAVFSLRAWTWMVDMGLFGLLTMAFAGPGIGWALGRMSPEAGARPGPLGSSRPPAPTAAKGTK